MKRRDFLNLSATTLALPPIEQLYNSVKSQVDKKAINTNYDVIVLGVGSMGSASCYYLAKRGVKVLGLEQFDIPHELGSHAGQSRIIRKAYFEHPDYVPLLHRAYDNWKELEEATQSQIYFRTGLLYLAKPDHLLMTGVHESADKYKIPIKSLSSAEVKSNYPQFNLPDYYEKLIEPDAGFVTPERAILHYVEQALQQGAAIHTKEKTMEWKKVGDGYMVKTNKNTYSCKKLVITAGPWASKMIPALSQKLTVTRQILAWVQPKKWQDFTADIFPCWTLVDEAKSGIYYGFPILDVGKFGGPIGLKLAHHYQGTISDPDNLNRTPTKEDEENLVGFLNKYIPSGYKTTHTLKTCMYTNTSDENFIVDFLPNTDNNVAIAAGFSGHGFKFASVIGEIMADLSINGKTDLPIGFLNAKRFL
jgi:sarcosine oxidase